MSYVQRHSVTVTTASDGTATAYIGPVNGKLNSIQYVKTDFADGVDFTITNETTGQSLWTESNVNSAAIKAPRQATHDGVGVASLYAAGGEPVEDKICLANDRVRIVIAQGGSTKVGAFHVIIE